MPGLNLHSGNRLEILAEKLAEVLRRPQGDGTFVQNVLEKFLKVGTRIQSELACNPGKMGKSQRVLEHAF
jgi:hypothetical protein